MTASSTDKINAAIANSNPFETLAIAREQDVWESGFPDISSVNAQASDAILQALQEVRSPSSTHQKIKTRVIVAAKGRGKSHTLARLRQHCDREKEAFFIYAGVEQYSLSAIEQEFHKTVVISLDKTGSSGVTQWQELATLMANTVWKETNPNSKTVTEKQLLKSVANLGKTEGKDREWVELMTDKFNKTYKQFDPDLIKAIFWTLSDSLGRYAVKWLSGQEIAPSKTQKLDLPASFFGVGQTKYQIFDNTLKILSLIAEYKSVIIGFDELDLPDSQRSKAGLARPQVVARLIKMIVDKLSLSKTSHGVVIVTVMMPDTWTQKVKSMPGGVPDRVSGTEKPILLQGINADAAVELIKLWLDEFYKSRKLVPPTPLYPFDEQKIRAIVAEGNSIRQMLRWCAENFQATVSDEDKFDGKKPPKSAPKSPVEQAYKKELIALESSAEIWLDEQSKIASALQLCFKAVKGKTIENVKIESIEPVEPKAKNKGYINFKIVGSENEKTVKIGVCVLQKSSGNSVGAALSRLIRYKTFDITRGCLVRSKEISPNAAKALEYANELVSKLGGEWVSFEAENVKPILALFHVHQGRGDYQLTDKQIVDFAYQSRLLVDNSLIREILSDPSGQVPGNLEKE